jgi:acyl transferase domain-containing protein/acyl carrier protein
VLVLADATGLGDELVELLRERGAAVSVVRPGDAYGAAEGSFTIRPGADDDYLALAQHLRTEGHVPATVAHMWSVDDAPAASAPAELEARQLHGFASVCRLARALDGVATDSIRIAIVSDRMQAVAPGEVPVPDKATLLGPCTVIPQEYPDVHCRSIDVRLDAPDLARRLHAELTWPESEPLIAHRGERLTRQLAGVPEPEAAAAAFREGGTYLVTGGLGGVGLLLAEHLVRSVGANVVLTTRSAPPPRGQWQHGDASEGERAEALRALSALDPGADRVLVVRADVTDEQQVRDAITAARERFGGLDAVVHAAAVTSPDSFRPLEHLEDAVWQAHFGAKLGGTLVLERVLRDEPLEFVLLQSSMSSVLGGLGFASYAAANAFLDAVPERHRDGPTRWLSVDWDTWEPTLRKIAGTGIGASMIENSLSTDHALEALDRCLALGLPRVVVAAGELAPRMRKWLTSAARDDAAADAHGGPERFARPDLAEKYVAAATDFERQVATLWQEVLGLDRVGVNDNFFELGGNSLMGLQLITRVKKEFGVRVPAVAMFEAPTIRTLAKYLGPGAAAPAAPPAPSPRAREVDGDAVAIVGMAGRFPGAATVEKLWENLRTGVESVRFFSDEELRASGVPDELIAHPDYVKARPVVDGIDEFDASFFRYSPREAALTDPQHRLFLEVAWEALEQAGHVAGDEAPSVGVFAGSNVSTYLLGLLSDPELVQGAADVEAIMSNDKDALPTTVSYKLDLRGPSLAVQSFSSTSLVAVHYAARSLLSGECDLALAGGASIHVPDRVGHLYEDGGQLSRDGHCRTFDADANGRMLGDAVAAVALKRLSDAQRDRDNVLAVIRGSAVNNDGSMKAGVETPSVAGLARVVRDAHDVAGVRPEQISYVEAYGTGTQMGDPIEVAALRQVFGSGDGARRCTLGSIKPNVGHLEHAAGVVGLIKTVLAIQHEELPPTLHFRRPNPDIDFGASPFDVSAEPRPWPADPDAPRLAGVTAVGRGGTNAHLVVEEPPSAPVRAEAPAGGQLLVLSARSAPAADEAVARLGKWLRDRPDARLGDVAWSLRAGRREFEHRRALVASSLEEASEALGAGRVLSGEALTDRPVAFLLAGVGEHYAGLGGSLFVREQVFREAFERCAELLGGDLERALVEPRRAAADGDAAAGFARMLGRAPAAETALGRAEVVQPALFAVEYALARLLADWGIRPSALLGYSLGEYVAACVSGALPLDQALALVYERARLIDQQPAGAMLALSLDRSRLDQLLPRELDVAAVNGSAMAVVAGPPAAIGDFERTLTAGEIPSRRLTSHHAFHSRLLDPIAGPLTEWAREHLQPRTPEVPYLSNLTGTWITADDLADPSYWARHATATVRFADNLEALLQDPDLALAELGAGQSLGAIARTHPACSRDRWAHVTALLPSQHEPRDDHDTAATAVAHLWLAGTHVDWRTYQPDHHRTPLPTYPFQRSRHWIDAKPRGPAAAPWNEPSANGNGRGAGAARNQQERQEEHV